MIQGAIEMYRLDRNVKTETLADYPKVAKLLVEGGYLQFEPRCMAPSYFYGRTRGGPGLIESMFSWAYTVPIQMTGPLEYRLDERKIPYCTAHGPLEGLRERAAAAQPFLADEVHDTLVVVLAIGIPVLLTVIVVRQPRRAATEQS